MTDDGACFFGLFFGEAGRNTHLKSRCNNLFGLEVVLKGLQPGDKDAIGKRLLYG